MRSDDQSGHMTILTIGLTLVVFSIAGLAVDGTKAFLLRRSLQNAADSAAVSAASSIDARSYYASGGATVELDEARARIVASRVLERRGLGAAEFSSEGDVVSIVLVGESPTSFLRLVGIENIPVGASASATPFPQVGAIAP